MSRLHLALLLPGGLLVVVGASLLFYLLLCAEGSFLRRSWSAYACRLHWYTSFLLMGRSGARIARAQSIACSILMGLSLLSREPTFGLLALFAALVPPLVLHGRCVARVGKLERQLDTWLLMLANALKATPSAVEAIGSTVTLVPSPFKDEVDLLVKEIHLGAPLDRALNAMALRINSTMISGALAMIVVARQTGGNLSQTLEHCSATLREGARLEGVLRTKTAEGRGQVLVLASVPFILCIVIGSLDRSWFDPMLEHRHGRTLLVVCTAVWTMASLWAHRIVKVDL